MSVFFHAPCNVSFLLLVLQFVPFIVLSFPSGKGKFHLCKAPVVEVYLQRHVLGGVRDHFHAPTPRPDGTGLDVRAALARALAIEPKLLFLDEPTSGLDPIGARNFDALIVELRDLLGITVVMITHDLESIFSIVDRMAVLADKKVVAEGSIESVLQSTHPFVEEFFKNEYTKKRFDKARDV